MRGMRFSDGLPQLKQPDEQKAGRQKASREKQKKGAEIGR